MSNIAIYEKLREHAGTSRGLGIPDDETHQDRLMLAGDMLRKHRACSVLDVGCGYGDLRMHVLYSSYMGIDVHEWMIEEARRRLPTTRFKQVALEDFEPQPLRFDTVVALGVLSTVSADELPAFMARLSRHASRLMCVSFMPKSDNYAGAFQQHDLADVRAGLPLLECAEAHGECTALMKLGT